LSNFGISSIYSTQLFIDEGFVACDSENLSKIPLFLQNMLNRYTSIFIVSHLNELKETTNKQIMISRCDDLSFIRYGTKLKIEKKKIKASASISSS
jgi:DNA repair exonuclease SbcCD ATPase subunit